MMKRSLFLLALILLLFLLLTGATAAMESTNYRLDWFTPLTGGGGGAASSTNYAVNVTIGQAVAGVSSGANHVVCLGYWCAGGAAQYRIYLPLVLRNF
jgi:hypothetical protein